MKSILKLGGLLLLLTFIMPSTAQAQFGWLKKKPAPAAPAASKPKGKLKPYKKVITKESETDSGLIIVHKVADKHYFELPMDLLEKEILVVSRISGYVRNLSFGGAGMKSRPQQVIRFQKMDDNVLLRSVSYNSVADEETPIYESVRNNNFEPVIMSFPIATMGKDSSSVVIEVSPLFTSDVPMIGALYDFQKRQFQVRTVDKRRSFISRMKSFPENTEIRHVLTYYGERLPDNQLTKSLSVELNQSFVLLPEEPMQPRLYDPRVGYFTVRQNDYSADEQKAATRRFITRWRLEPRDEDMAAYRRGELVEPKKQIVYYVDPATPKEWVPYLIQGVNDWQKAFEKAGFKNAIIGKEAPTKEEDPDWTPEDVRYSVIRYVATDIQNAMGPHVHDPRTGEILESDIIWYHNVMNLLRNWYFVQTAAINPEAQMARFDQKTMGELIRFVSAHEVGHTLGLPHNMGSSVAYPVDSLRSKTFTDANGTAPSIMDYARFNYIAQPEDNVTKLHPDIGPYDEWSIIYGYKMVPGVTDFRAEKKILNDWIVERAGQPIYRYGPQQGLPTDPTSQTEDLGDDAMLASEYGIKNLKRIVPKLLEWSTESGETYEDLGELYNNVLGQMNRYMGHVAANVGGVVRMAKTADEEGVVYTPVPREKQARAVKFINEQLFETPEWLIDREILRRVEGSGTVNRVRRFQVRTLNNLLNPDRLNRMIENETIDGDAYSLLDMMADVRKGIFSEVQTGAKVDTYRRNLQRAFVDRLGEVMTSDSPTISQSDIKAVTRATLKRLESDLRSGAARQSDELSRYHFEDLAERVDMILNPEG